jgi:hypothetical protein
MASLRTGIPLSVGLVSTDVRIDSAVPSVRSDLRSVCPGNHTLDPDRLHMKYTCDDCGPLTDKPNKARKVNGVWQVTDSASVTASRNAAAEPFKYRLAMSVYPTEDVEKTLCEGAKSYWLAPDGVPEIYATIAEAVALHPELTFLTRFAIRSATAVYRLTVRDGALMITEYILRTGLRPAPAIPDAPDPRLVAVMEDRVLPGVIEKFTPEAVALPDGLSAAFAGATEVPAPRPAPNSTDALLALLEAELAVANKPKPKRAPRARKTATPRVELEVPVL